MRVKRFLFSALAVVVLTGVMVQSPVDASASALPHGTRLLAGHTWPLNGRLVSPSGTFVAVNVGHGRVEVMRTGHPVWESSVGTGLSSVLGVTSNGSLRIKSRARTSPAGSATSVVVDDEGDLALLNRGGVTTWQAGLHAHVSSSSISPYTRGALYGPTNPSVVCFTCDAAEDTGTAPPSNTLDAGTGVDAMTGDFSTENSLFDAPAIGGGLGITLSYDAQLAQSQPRVRRFGRHLRPRLERPVHGVDQSTERVVAHVNDHSESR
jgi:hypothetical protein